MFKNTVAIQLGEKEAAVLLGFGFVFAPAFAKAKARQAVIKRYIPRESNYTDYNVDNQQPK